MARKTNLLYSAIYIICYISEAQHAVECRTYREDRVTKSKGPGSREILCEVERRHLHKDLPRNFNASQSKTTSNSESVFC